MLVAIFQFSPSPTALQFFSWLIYLVVVGTLFYFYNRNQKLFITAKRSQKEDAATPGKEVANAGVPEVAEGASDGDVAVAETDNQTKTSVAAG